MYNLKTRKKIPSEPKEKTYEQILTAEFGQGRKGDRGSKKSFWYISLNILLIVLVGIILLFVVVKDLNALEQCLIVFAFLIAGVGRIFSVIHRQLLVTNKRVLGKSGFLSIKMLDYPIEKVDNVSVEARLFGRLFHYYAISVQSAGSTRLSRKGEAQGIRFNGIVNAIYIKNQISAAIEAHAEEARKSQAEEIAQAMEKGSR